MPRMQLTADKKTHLTGLACLSSLTGIIIVIIITLIREKWLTKRTSVSTS